MTNAPRTNMWRTTMDTDMPKSRVPIPETSSTMLRQLASGADSERWADFVDLYTPILEYWLRILKRGPYPALSPDMFDDIMQETFVSLMKTLPQGGYEKSRARFRTLLQTILRHRAVDYLRKSDFAKLSFLPEEDLRKLSEADMGVPKAESSRQDDEDAAQLRSDLLRLVIDRVLREANYSGRTKAIFMRAAAGESATALAGEFGIDRNAVDQLKFRIMGKIAAKVKALQKESDDILDMICALGCQGAKSKKAICKERGV